ncbi:DUF5706 domain-containing protein [Niallia sp. XMNu-256]|uniref:Pycsar system effector family protein n=1 Tax=Niallia sp. XMNu-256 TaxID=3082444 RepID=UPI0030D1CFED
MDIEKSLNDLYNDFKEWLKFADTRNAALLIFNSTLLVCLISYEEVIFPKEFELSPWLFTICTTATMISIIILFISFLPRRFKKLKNKGSSYPTFKNLLHYGDIYQFSPGVLLSSLENKYKFYESSINDDYLYDFSFQIIALARILKRKDRIFNYAIVINLIIVVFISFSILLVVWG